MYAVRFFSPYRQCWQVQSFSSLDEAQRMVAFYLSCGSQAHLA